jgi:hypothetical protein
MMLTICISVMSQWRRLSSLAEMESDDCYSKRRGVGGIALHADGGLVVAGKNICHVKDSVTRILFQRDDIPGFNDILLMAPVGCTSVLFGPTLSKKAPVRLANCGVLMEKIKSCKCMVAWG